jgi:hypothetical protein
MGRPIKSGDDGILLVRAARRPSFPAPSAKKFWFGSETAAAHIGCTLH